MAYTAINFSRSALLALPHAPAGKRAYYTDTKEPGLLLCVTSSGTKSFQIYMKRNKRPLRVTLGRFSSTLADSVELPKGRNHNEFLSNTPELNVRMARDLAALVKIDLKSGINPAEAKRAKRAEPTLGELFEEYMTRHLESQGKKSNDATRAHFERFFGEIPKTGRKKHGEQRTKTAGGVNWQRRVISTISKTDIQKVIADLGREAGKHSANRALTIIRAMYNNAIEWGLYDKPNPAIGVPSFKVKSRERFLESDELPRFFRAVAMEPNPDIRDYILLGLLSGGRKGNVLAMRWADLNLQRGTWLIPGEFTKNGDPVTVPLMTEAIQILQNRKPAKKAEYVFPGRRGGTTGHMVNPRAGWCRVLDYDELAQLTLLLNAAGEHFKWPLVKKKGSKDHSRKVETLKESLQRARTLAAKLEIDTTGSRLVDLRPHDLRRTMGSWQASTGASLVIIGKSLGHKSVASTQIYSRLNIDPVRDSMQTATNAMLAAGGLRPKAKVVPIKKRAGAK